jgi:hypothetical protein
MDQRMVHIYEARLEVEVTTRYEVRVARHALSALTPAELHGWLEEKIEEYRSKRIASIARDCVEVDTAVTVRVARDDAQVSVQAAS